MQWASECFPCLTFNSTCPLGKLERTERTSLLYRFYPPPLKNKNKQTNKQQQKQTKTNKQKQKQKQKQTNKQKSAEELS